MHAIISHPTLLIEEISFSTHWQQILELRQNCIQDKDPALAQMIFPAGMNDEHDDKAMHWGMFDADHSLIACARMSVHRDVSELPDRFLFADIWELDLPAPLASFNRLSVAPAHRCQGISAQMDRLRIEKAKRIGCRSVCSTTYGNRAQKLLEDGFTRYHSSMLSTIYGTDSLTGKQFPLDFYYRLLS